jgi:hypothetical protein
MAAPKQEVVNLTITDYMTIDLTMNLHLMVSHITINCELMKTQCRHITKEEDQLNSNAVLVE